MNILTPTADNSNTLFNELIGEHYHSTHGALQESKHVFIDAGLKFATSNSDEINILEVGFGTGLNFILTLSYCEEHNIRLNYTSIEAFPLGRDVLTKMGYDQYVDQPIWEEFINGYEAALLGPQQLSAKCKLQIANCKLEDFVTAEKYDLVYYDAFSVRHQPEMWTDEMLAKTCSMLKPGGIFVTYAITGNLKRAIKACGFEIQKLPGAPGKREMLRAIKL